MVVIAKMVDATTMINVIMVAMMTMTMTITMIMILK